MKIRKMEVLLDKKKPYMVYTWSSTVINDYKNVNEMFKISKNINEKNIFVR